MKVIGYGICGPGEADRYMRATMEEFKRLCDVVIILVNNATKKELDLINEYGFTAVHDRREWGRTQWKIKQDFIERDIKAVAEEGDMLVCLDMDEVFSKKFTKDWILSAPLDAYYFFFTELWNDEEHHKEKLAFWNVRLWRWNGDTKFKDKPLHCGLAPKWAYTYHRFAPFVVKHYGTMKLEDRQNKIERYAKYDPKSEYLERDAYYAVLAEEDADPFDEEEVQKKIEKEVATYQQSKPKTPAVKPVVRYAYVKTPSGAVVDIPEYTLAETLKRKGFELVKYHEEE